MAKNARLWDMGFDLQRVMKSLCFSSTRAHVSLCAASVSLAKMSKNVEKASHLETTTKPRPGRRHPGAQLRRATYRGLCHLAPLPRLASTDLCDRRCDVGEDGRGRLGGASQPGSLGACRRRARN